MSVPPEDRIVVARPNNGRWIVLGIVLFALVCIGVWAFMATRPQPARVVTRDIVGLVPLNGEITTPPSARADVWAPFRAPVEKVHATVGKNVMKGDVLVELSVPNVQAAVEQARQNVKSAETAYANARNQYDDSVNVARQQLAQAQATERTATTAPAPTPSPDGTVPSAPTTDRTQATEARIAAQQALESAQATMDNALQPYKQQLDTVREAYRQAQSGENLTTLRAPITGTVLALNAQPGKEVGVDRKTPVATVVNLAEIQVQATMTPEQGGYVKQGMPVRLAFKETGAQEFEGKVAQITSRVDTKIGGLIKEQEYVAVIEFKNQDAQVKPGMTPQVAVKTGSVQNALAVPNEAVDTDKTGRPIVNAMRNGKWEQVAVQTGISDGKYVQVKSGLKEGEVVQITPNLLHAGDLPGVK